MKGNTLSIEKGSEHLFSITSFRKVTILKLSAPRPMERQRVRIVRSVKIMFPNRPQKLRNLYT